MLPDGVLSTEPVIANFIGARAYSGINDWLDFEDGGAGLNDPSQGLLYQAWKARLTLAGEVWLSAPNTPEFLLYSAPGITEISLAFSQNMEPHLAFVENGEAKLWWYDTTIPGHTVMNLGSAVITPRICLDDKRLLQSAISDIIMMYVKAGDLYYRQQRDRFGVEYLLQAGVGDKGIRKIGLTTQLRLQVQINV